MVVPGIRPRVLLALLGCVTLSAIALPASIAAAADHVIKIVSDYDNLRMVFDPKFLRIEPGDQVTWVNEANEEHNVMTFPDGFPNGATAFQSPIMTKAGESFSHRFDVPGTYEYHCLPHLPMGMHGQIIVGRPSENDEFHRPSQAEVKAYRKLMLEWFDDDDVEMLELDERASTEPPDLTAHVHGSNTSDDNQ